MLKTEIALVTGASRGIGQAIALELARRGAAVAGTATTAAGAQRIQEQLEATASEPRVLGLPLDVADTASIDETIKQIIEKLGGPPSILVNNAGITRDNLLLRMKDDEWDQVLAVNLTAVFKLTKVCLRAMTKARHGRIINIASVVGLTGNAGQVNYTATKAGLIGFSKSLAQEVGSRGITVNCIAPGFIDTDMTRALPESQRQALLTHIPLGRLGQTKDIAAMVAFLASSEASYITGETIHINGGMYMA
jgi:3-oxoacyl-[acyl-carrier protein] reductase